MSAQRINRLPIGLALLFLIVLFTVWHGRENAVLQFGDKSTRPNSAAPPAQDDFLAFEENELPPIEDPLLLDLPPGAEVTPVPSTPSSVAVVPAAAIPPVAAPAATRPSFYEIGMKFGTDKVNDHHYERMYEHHLAPYRDQPLKMLEIGLGCDMWYGPGASYHTWLEYFSQVDLYFIEYNADCAAKWTKETERATIFTGDQADRDFLARFVQESGGNFDIIIDDGGHTMNQQKVSLEGLWDAVKPGGTYFIEDLDTSYRPEYEGGGSDSFMEVIKHMMDDINKHPGVPDTHRVSKDVERMEMTQEVVALIKSKNAAVVDGGFNTNGAGVGQ